MTELLTTYGEKLDAQRPLWEYPRPQMERDSYLCLNGVWRYAITQSEAPPTAWDGDIVVPFSPESVLSGVGRLLQPGEFLWYERQVALPPAFNRGRVLLHFGAVDQRCTLWMNEREVGRHEGGYLPFSFDVTEFLLPRVPQTLRLVATDATDAEPFARGRQRLEHGGMWHRPQSGIWQTVWAESVPDSYIAGLRITPLYDQNAVEVLVEAGGTGPLDGRIEIRAMSTLAATAEYRSGVPVRIPLPGALSWSPSMPFLYQMKVTTFDDEVRSYFGMRKLELRQNDEGHTQLWLNNKPFVGVGIVDQALFSDGLYTPPGDRAMLDDLRFAREAGFNMIRKTGKIEPLRWYYHCDKTGMLVWQDVPAGGGEAVPTLRQRLFSLRPHRQDSFYRLMGREDEAGRRAFEADLAAMAHLLRNTPCLGVWVLFQEGAGQFDAARLAEVMKQLDPGRLVDHASGWYDQGGGDFYSLHLETDARRPQKRPEPVGRRVRAVTQSGLLGLVPKHHFAGRRPCAARLCESREAYSTAVAALYQEQLLPLARQGFGLFFVAQLTDAEDEVSGFISADRRVKKLHAKGLATLNELLLEEAKRHV